MAVILAIITAVIWAVITILIRAVTCPIMAIADRIRWLPLRRLIPRCCLSRRCCSRFMSSLPRIDIPDAGRSLEVPFRHAERDFRFLKMREDEFFAVRGAEFPMLSGCPHLPMLPGRVSQLTPLLHAAGRCFPCCQAKFSS